MRCIHKASDIGVDHGGDVCDGQIVEGGRGTKCETSIVDEDVDVSEVAHG